MAATGRPTKYTDTTVSQAKHYLDNYQDYGDVVPMIAGLAIALDISRETVYAWSNDESKVGFSDIVDKIQTAQNKALVNGSLVGAYNPTIAKLMLTSHHGYSDKQEVDQTVKGSHTVEHTVSSVDKFADILKDYSEPEE